MLSFFDGADDGGGIFGPAKGCGQFLVVNLDEVLNLALEFGRTGKNSAA